VRDFCTAHDISSYSLRLWAKAALLMMQGRHAAILTPPTCAERVVPNHNTMGAAKASPRSGNPLSGHEPGPKAFVPTLLGRADQTFTTAGISGFQKMLDVLEQ
jgi:enoyl-[acyl-carrier protein] reductase I